MSVYGYVRSAEAIKKNKIRNYLTATDCGQPKRNNMHKHYFKIAWRNLWKNKIISIINIFGLSAGIAFAMLIAGYVWNELQVNKHLKNADNQYILQSKWKDLNMGLELSTLGPLPKALKEQYPHLVANYYRFDGITSNISKGDKAFRENIQLSDSTLFTMYGFKLIHGDERTALNAPFTMVITTEKAVKYFGKTDVVGQTLAVENFSADKHDFLITGVTAADLDQNSVTYLNENNDNQFIISNRSISYFGRDIDNWANPYVIGYVELKDGVLPSELEEPMNRLIRQNAPGNVSENLKPELVQLKSYYLDANNGLVRKMLYVLSGIALFILLMAIVNFVNISIGKSANRMKEIGLRKVLGGRRNQLIIQLLTESVLLVFFATLFALVIYEVSNSYFATVLGKNIPALSAYPAYFIVILFSVILFVGTLAGIYPAFFLSSLKSVDSLKGKLAIEDNVLLRKALVGFQFCTAVMVFAGALIISKQVDLFFSSDLGYDKDFVISAQVPRDWSPEGQQRLKNIRNQFAALPQVEAAAISYEIPNGQNSGPSLVYKASADSTQAISTQTLIADENYAKTYGLSLVSGSFFHPEGYSDSLNVVINETQAKAFGWKSDEAVGRKLKIQGRPAIFTVTGVTKDFHFGSMQKVIQPVTFFHVRYNPFYRYLSFKLYPGHIEKSLVGLQKKWSVLLPGAPFEYTFMDQTLEKLYKTEMQLKKASYAASGLSLIIVSLGILGLISLNVQKRTKEIGIRKLLGSSVAGIVSLFMKEFLFIMLWASLVACPLAYIMMQGWLNDYAHRIPLTALPFIVSILILGSITAVVIVLQTIKVALANPVKSLRTE